MVIKPDRFKKVQKILSERHLEALLVENPIDLFYLTGLKLSSGKLVVSEKESVLFVDGRYLESAEKNAPCKVAHLNSFDLKDKKVGFDAASTSYLSWEELQKKSKELVPLDSPIKKIRAIKEKEEIELLGQAADLGARGYDNVLTWLKSGVVEEEIAKKLEIFWLENGGEKIAFEPIIVFGPNSSQPHYRAGEKKLEKGDMVLIDIGVMKASYASDMTRVTFFGQPNEEMKKIYSSVRDAQGQAFEMCQVGTPLREIEKAAREVIERAGYGEYFPHGLGHGVGLEVHEYPTFKSDELLKPGMVLTLEPGIYLRGLGGVRLEDTVVITEKGATSLTRRPLAHTLPHLI